VPKGSIPHRVAERLGLRPIGASAIMRRGLRGLKAGLPDGGGLKYVRLRPGQGEELSLLHNRIFVDASSPSMRWIFEPLTAETAEKWLKEPRLKIYSVYHEDDVAGLVGISPAERVGKIPFLGLLPRFRGRGLGGRLLAFALRRLRELGAVEAELGVDLGNIPAVKLYRRAGFKPVEEHLYYEG